MGARRHRPACCRRSGRDSIVSVQANPRRDKCQRARRSLSKLAPLGVLSATPARPGRRRAVRAGARGSDRCCAQGRQALGACCARSAGCSGRRHSVVSAAPATALRSRRRARRALARDHDLELLLWMRSVDLFCLRHSPRARPSRACARSSSLANLRHGCLRCCRPLGSRLARVRAHRRERARW